MSERRVTSVEVDRTVQRIESLSQRLAEVGKQIAAAAIVWECLAKWLWLLGGRGELETWEDAGDGCTEV